MRVWTWSILRTDRRPADRRDRPVQLPQHVRGMPKGDGGSPRGPQLRRSSARPGCASSGSASTAIRLPRRADRPGPPAGPRGEAVPPAGPVGHPIAHAGRKPDLSSRLNGATFRPLATTPRGRAGPRQRLAGHLAGSVRGDDPPGRASTACWTGSLASRRPASRRSVNAVSAGVNDDEIVALAEFGRDHDVQVRHRVHALDATGSGRRRPSPGRDQPLIAPSTRSSRSPAGARRPPTGGASGTAPATSGSSPRSPSRSAATATGSA
jgi:hypothetical protein